MSGFTFGAQSQASNGGSAHGSPARVESTNSGLNVILRGLQKRDAVTKLRASEELLAFVETGAAADDEVLQHEVLRYLSRHLQSLVLEEERRIRISAYNLLASILGKLGKKSGYAMRDVAGLWTLGLNDVDKSVRRAATQSFGKTFATPEKRANFYQVFGNDITETALTYAFEKTAEILSDARFVNAAGIEYRYTNAVSSALRTLRDMIERKASREEQDEVASKVVDKDRFWEHVSSNDLAIRSAALSLIGALHKLESSALARRTERLSRALAKVLLQSDAVTTDVLRVLRGFLQTAPAGSQGALTDKKSLTGRFDRLLREAQLTHFDAEMWNAAHCLGTCHRGDRAVGQGPPAFVL